MSKSIEVKYFNSFILRKTVKGDALPPLWCGDPANPEYYPAFPIEVATSSDKNWYIEESRIRGGFNTDEVDLGVRAYLTNDDNKATRAENSIIYSGVLNDRTGINQTNVFSVADDITKSLDPRYGEIGFLFSDDTNLTIFQEYKVSSVLVDKDALYTAEGNRSVTSSNLFLGDVRQYSGDRGIGKFPESFAENSGRKYFADALNSEVIRLSLDGITPISDYGMKDYFNDELGRLSSGTKRYVVDVTWEVPWGLTTDTITVSGSNISELDYGMAIEGVLGVSGLYITDIGTESGGEVDITLNKELSDLDSPQNNSIQAIKYVKDRIVGGYDTEYENYVISTQYYPPSKSSSSGLAFEPVEDELEPE